MNIDSKNVYGTVWYTGKTTGGTAIDADLVAGYVLCADVDEEVGDGFAKNYTRPETANLNQRKCIVLDVPSAVNDTISTGVRRGGKVKVAWVLDGPPPLGFFVNGTTNDITATSLLGVTNGSFALWHKASIDGTCCARSGAAYATDAEGRITKGTFNGLA